LLASVSREFERRLLRAAHRQALWRGAVFRLSALLPHRLREPVGRPRWVLPAGSMKRFYPTTYSPKTSRMG